MGGAWFANSCQGNAYDRGTNALRYVPRDCAMNILLLSLYQWEYTVHSTNWEGVQLGRAGKGRGLAESSGLSYRKKMCRAVNGKLRLIPLPCVYESWLDGWGTVHTQWYVLSRMYNTYILSTDCYQ